MSLKKNTEVINMSKMHKITFNCPECGEEVEFDCYESVNVTLNPELKEKIVNGEIYSAICPNCGHHELIKHPILYHDMDKNFMIQTGSYSELLNFKEEFINNPDNKDFLGLMTDIKVIGVTSMFDMISAILAFDNDLDWRVVQMTLLFAEYNFQKYCSDNNKMIKDIRYSRLTDERNEDGDLMIKICVEENESIEEYYYPFSIEMYQHCVKEFKDRLDQIDPFVFNRNMRDHFCNFFEEEFQLHEEHKNKYTFIETSGGDILISYDIPKYLVDSVGIDSLIVFKTSDGKRGIGSIKRVVEYNSLSVSIPKEDFCTIECSYKEYHFLTTDDSDAELGQEELIKELIDYKNMKSKRFDEAFPIEDLKESKMIVCSKMSVSIEGMDKGTDDELVELLKKDLETGNSEVVSSLQKIEQNGKTYLAIYSDQRYLPEDNQYLSKAVFDFDTFARIIKIDPRYDGIIINQFDDNIVLTTNQIKLYIQCRTLANELEMKKLLENLSSKEFEYMGELSYKCVKSIYFEDDNPKSLEQKYNLTREQVDKALDRAYNVLDDIVFERF